MHWALIILKDPFTEVVLTVTFGVPLYQLARKCFSKRLQNMLKTMGIGLFCCLVKEVSEIAILSMMMGGEYCHHFDNNTIDSCYFLTSKLNINGTCLTISNLTDNYFHFRQDNTSFLLLTDSRSTRRVICSSCVHDCTQVCLCSGSSSTERATSRCVVCFTDY